MELSYKHSPLALFFAASALGITVASIATNAFPAGTAAATRQPVVHAYSPPLRALTQSADVKAEFTRAMADYKSGERTAAYGRFMRLADAGDAEAARIALILLRYGPELHGVAWGASQPQIDRWMKLARTPMERIIAESGD